MVDPVEFDPANRMSVPARHQPPPLSESATGFVPTRVFLRYTNGRPPDSNTATVFERPSVTSLNDICAFFGKNPFVGSVAVDVIESLACSRSGGSVDVAAVLG